MSSLSNKETPCFTMGEWSSSFVFVVLWVFFLLVSKDEGRSLIFLLQSIVFVLAQSMGEMCVCVCGWDVNDLLMVCVCV